MWDCGFVNLVHYPTCRKIWLSSGQWSPFTVTKPDNAWSSRQHLRSVGKMTVLFYPFVNQSSWNCWDFVAWSSLTLYSHALAGCAHLLRPAVPTFCTCNWQSIDVTQSWPAACYVCRLVSAVSLESYTLHGSLKTRFYGTVCCSTKFWEQSANWANSR